MPRKYRRQISFSIVLARIKSRADGERFVLEHIKASGKHKGTLVRGEYRYGAPTQEVHTPRAKATGDLDRREHVERGTLPLTRLDKGVPRYQTPLISHLISYNDMKIMH